MPSVFYFPAYQALSGSGTPLAGARLTFSRSGTSTAAAVYADAARTTALSNPVVADAQGRFAQIYPDPELLYRVRLTDSSNVLQWQEDGVSPQLFPATQAELDAGVTPVNYSFPVGNVKRYGAMGDGAADDSAAIQNAFKLIRQYDPTQTTHDGNNFTYMGRQIEIYFPAGRYRVLQELNLSFRNQWRIRGESEYDTLIQYDGPASTHATIINASCSNYVEICYLTLNGGFKATCGIYCAGNGNNAPSSKGNVTGNHFHHLFFWNQPGDLTPIVNDYPDQYAPRSAMLCLMTDTAADTSYNSCDDSYVSHCRFATNSVNNHYALAVSSSNIQINNCILFAANGCLLGNGAAPVFHQCAFEIYGYQAIDATHNHACLKYSWGGFGYGFVTLTDCYSESGYNGTTPTTAVVAYLAQYAGGGSLDLQPRVNLLIQGGLYSIAKDSVAAINIQGGNRGHIRVVNALFQGSNKPLIYAPDCAVYVEDYSDVTSASSNNYQTWQALSTSSYRTWTRKFTTPDGTVAGEASPNVTVIVGNTNYPAQLKFTSMDEALSWVSASRANVTIQLQRDDTISRAINLWGNLTLNLGDHTLTWNAIVQNFGALTINGGGTAISTARKLFNFGSLTLVACTVNALVTSLSGTVYATGCVFSGTDDSIGISSGESRVVIDHETSTYSGSEFVVSLAGSAGTAVVQAQNGTTPASGKWARGTIFRNLLPASGAPVLWYATSNGVGASANWKHQGNLS